MEEVPHRNQLASSRNDASTRCDDIKKTNFVDTFNEAVKKLKQENKTSLPKNKRKNVKKYKWEHFCRDAPKIVRLYIPVLVSLFFVLFSVVYLDYYRVPVTSFDFVAILPRDDLQVDRPLRQSHSQVSQSKPFSQPSKPETEDYLAKTWVILVAIGALFLFLLLGTILLLILYKYGYSNIIMAVSTIPYVIYLGVFPLVYIQELFYTLNVAVDYILVCFFLYNQVIVGFIVLFYEGPKWAKQIYSIIISAMLSLIIIKFVNEWIEVGLMTLLVCWDLYAVLHPKGPLIGLLDATSKEGALPPVTVFQMSAWRQVNSCPVDQLPSNAVQRKLVKPLPPSPLDSFQIGLGDLIVYSILVAKTYLYAGTLGAIFSMVSLIFGLTVTFMVLIVSGHTLPATPFPVTFALVAQLLTQYAVGPFADQLNWAMIFI